MQVYVFCFRTAASLPLQPRLSKSLPQIWQTSVNKEIDEAKVFPAGLTVAL